ncbi:hypothetical protein NX059_009807 [Plenodomus lindquistii]|nr:hypothetical protein NX059_009807 [Plenodomus lindquistii]
MSTNHDHPAAAHSNSVYQEYAQVRADDMPSPHLQPEHRDSVSSVTESFASTSTNQAHEVERLEPLNINDHEEVFQDETTPATFPLVPAPGTSTPASSTTISLGDLDASQPRWLSRIHGWLRSIPRPSTKRNSSKSKSHNGIKNRWRSHRYIKMWWWEATCYVIALTALMAIVITIRVHEDKPLPQWRYGLTVNAMIAIYTVILKAAAGLVLAEGISHLKWIAVARPQSLSTFVAHDDASRGPLGAFNLL